MTFRALPMLAVAAAALLPLAAQAQPVTPGKEYALAQILAPVPGTQACFRRDYSKEHLAAHPDQTVKSMEFRVAYHRFEPEQNYPEGQRNYYFQMFVERRGEEQRLEASGECTSGPEGQIFCGVECDGGGLGISAGRGGGLMVDLTAHDYIRMTQGCGGEDGDFVLLGAGKDDKLFRLDRVADAQCPAYDNWFD